MKLIILFVCGWLWQFEIVAQNLEASYSVTREIIVENKGKLKQIAKLELTGHLYQRKSRGITFLRPLYLKDYPDAEIPVKIRRYPIKSYAILMDTLQSLTYIDTDSLVYRTCMEIAGGFEGPNYVYPLKPGGYEKNWKLLPESKVINGYTCKRATMQDKQGNITTDVWYTDSIKTFMNLFGKLGLPGLMIEGTVFQGMEQSHFKLLKYTPDATFSDSVFWPNVFNRGFVGEETD